MNFVQIQIQRQVMASASTGSRSPRLGRPPRGWVRKNLHIDQRKLDTARKVLGVKTETETVDAALDAIALREELTRGIRRARAAGGLKDIYKD
jgi:Arc/MetJ family transcription regulator